MSGPEVHAAEEEEADATPEGGGQKKWIVVVVGALLGAAVGFTVVGPRFVPGSDDPTEAVDEGHESESESIGAEGVLEVDNIVANPAGSNGLRFLMATIAFDIGDKHLVEEMRRENYRFRDRVIAVLESQTMEMLTAVGARDSLKALLADAVNPLLQHGHVIQVFIPHLVIQ